MRNKNRLNWYLPTFHGDIALENQGDATLVKVEKLVPSEVEALNVLRAKAIEAGWQKPDLFPEPATSLVASIPLKAPIDVVQAVLAEALKPGRKQFSVVRFANGVMEEITEQTKPKAIEKGKAAATVAAPTQGCPLPEFDRQFHRARRVLAEFLTTEQLEDFDKENAFISVGVDTGHRYLLRSREAGRGHESFRSLFDLDEQQAFCIHDWTVPAPEELLSLHLHLQVPGQEIYLRGVPDTGMHG